MVQQRLPYLTPVQVRQIEGFKRSLLGFGGRLNLFSRAGQELEGLFEESLVTGRLLSPLFSAAPVLDLGSGNGFPGLICGILYPKTPFVLCEKNRKKAEFLKQTLFHIKCPNIQVLCQSAEEIQPPFSLVLSKATGPLKQVLSLLEIILTETGMAILWKSPAWKKDWPKNSTFSTKIFKPYAIVGKKRVLLQVKKSGCSL